MMAYSEDQIALAAEYALGTLDAEERLQAETMMSADKEFAAMVYQPDLLPEAIRQKPRTQVAEVKTPSAPTPPTPRSAQYVAVLQKEGGAPAFILTVDAATRIFTVRKVGASAEPGKSFELWLISDKLQRPRSLGVIGNSDFTARAVLASYDNDVINNATYAVTVEQAGGSPDGMPHPGPGFTRKLSETVPPAAPAPSSAR